jgi:DNA-binding NarL/FixJ family response regulator
LVYPVIAQYCGTLRKRGRGKEWIVNVFLVDDSPLLRDRLKDMLLTVPGIEIAGEADNSGAAIDGILRLNPDVAIVDIRMPGGSGMEVIKSIQDADLPIVVIVLTNYPYRQYRERCLTLGADFFLDKSNDFERIPEVLEQLMQASAARGKKAKCAEYESLNGDCCKAPLN